MTTRGRDPEDDARAREWARDVRERAERGELPDERGNTAQTVIKALRSLPIEQRMEAMGITPSEAFEWLRVESEMHPEKFRPWAGDERG